MKQIKSIWIILGLVPFISMAFSLLWSETANGQMCGGDMKGMREMMQRMMPGDLPPGIDPKLLPKPESKGAHLLTGYCAQCHNLPGPGMHTADEWPTVIERMQARMAMHNNMMGGVAVPTTDELATIGDYLRHHAMRQIDASAYTDLDSPSGRAFRETCSQCHALPDPTLHTSNEWPKVVTRMRGNISVMGKSVPSKENLKKVIEFLQQHAQASQ